MERMHSSESDLGSVPNSDTFQALSEHVCLRLAPGPSRARHSRGAGSLAGYVMVPSPRPGLPPAPRQKPTSVRLRLPCSKGSVWISVPATIHSTRFLTESTAGREGPAVGLGGAASGTGFLRRPGRPALQRVSECRAWTLCCSGIGH